MTTGVIAASAQQITIHRFITPPSPKTERDSIRQTGNPRRTPMTVRRCILKRLIESAVHSTPAARGANPRGPANLRVAITPRDVNIGRGPTPKVFGPMAVCLGLG
jgi:hypothetical protein